MITKRWVYRGSPVLNLRMRFLSWGFDSMTAHTLAVRIVQTLGAERVAEILRKGQ